MKLYIRRNEKNHGPYPIDQLKQLLEEGKLVRNDQASKDKIVWLDLGQFLDAKDNEASISEPPSIEDLYKDSKEIVSAKSKPVSESAPEESESVAPKQKKSSRSSANKQPDDKVIKPISSFQENSNTKPKKKLLGVFVYSVIVLIVSFAAFFLGTLVDENDELKAQLSILKSQSATDQHMKVQRVVSKSTIRDKTLIIKLVGKSKNEFGFREKLILPFNQGIPEYGTYLYENFPAICILKNVTKSLVTDSNYYEFESRIDCYKSRDIKFENMNLLEAWDKFRSSTWGSIFYVTVEPVFSKKDEYQALARTIFWYDGHNLSFSVE